MRRLLFAAVTLFAAPVLAADPTPLSATVTLRTLTVTDGRVPGPWVVEQPVPQLVPVVMNLNGRPVVRQKVVVQPLLVQRQTTILVRDLTATGVDGKPITADEMEKRLTDGSKVVAHTGPLAAKFRALFNDDTVFLDETPTDR